MGIGPTELFVIILLAVVLFGARKIPELARGVGEGIREFKKAARDANESEKSDDKKQQIKAPEDKN
ncbi:twin-arginine translocase TatA/TatE family subunit [candidate division KSB1 bacterium]|nr:twin-arginine translocase TatA/TatE family subunit [candidate division KSB1 bacterium]